MPNEYARSGFHSGETASGYFDEALSITLGATDITRRVDFHSLEIVQRLNGPGQASLSFSSRTVVPTYLQEVKIYNGGVDVGEALFGGHVLRIRQRVKRKGDRPIFDLTVSDYRWLLDRLLLINARYRGLGVNAVLAQLLATPSADGFSVGYADMALGDVDDLSFSCERVSVAIDRLAGLVSEGLWAIDAMKRVSIFTPALSEFETFTLNNSRTDVWDVVIEWDASQLRNSQYVSGGGSQTTERVAGTLFSQDVPVEEMGWYTATDDLPGIYAYPTLKSGVNVLGYADKSVATGPGSLLDVSNFIDDLPKGAPVQPLALEQDFTSQTDIQTKLSAGNGIVVGYAADGRLNYDSCVQRAAALLARYAEPLISVRFTTTADIAVGQLLSLSLTAPTTVSANLQVQEIRTVGRRKMDGSTVELKFDRIVTAGPIARQFSDALLSAGVS